MPNNEDQEPQHARGCDLSQVPKAEDVPPVDLKALLGVDSSNPFLRQLRIQQGLLNADDLPTELRGQVPAVAPEAPEAPEDHK